MFCAPACLLSRSPGNQIKNLLMVTKQLLIKRSQLLFFYISLLLGKCAVVHFRLKWIMDKAALRARPAHALHLSWTRPAPTVVPPVSRGTTVGGGSRKTCAGHKCHSLSLPWKERKKKDWLHRSRGNELHGRGQLRGRAKCNHPVLPLDCYVTFGKFWNPAGI